MAALRAAAALALVALLPACSSVGDAIFGEDDAIESAHAVFIARAGCDYLIAKTAGGGYAVLAPRGDYTPRPGDLVVGDLRTGRLSLGVVPTGTAELREGQPFDVVEHDLAIEDAQDLYYGFCPPLPDPPASPGLPLAPEGVPVTPSDTVGVF